MGPSRELLHLLYLKQDWPRAAVVDLHHDPTLSAGEL